MPTLAQAAVTLGRFPAVLHSLDIGIYNVELVGRTTASAYNAALAIYNAQKAAVATEKLQVIPVTVGLGANSGTAVVTAGAIVIGCVPSSNQDQFINNVAISSTTLTITLHANATAASTFNVAVLNP